MRGQGKAAILATHNLQWLPFADQILVLGEGGLLLEKGTFAELNTSGGYVSRLQLKQDPRDDGETGRSSPSSQKPTAEAAKRPTTNGLAVTAPSKAQNSRATNTSALLYYIKTMGRSSFLIFLATVVFQVACRTMQRESTLWTTGCVQRSLLTLNSRRTVAQILGFCK
jgi:hypothetical protein